MQLVIPHEVVQTQITRRRTGREGRWFAQVILSRDIRRRSEVLGRVIVHMRHQRVDVKDRDRSTGVPFGDQQFVRGAVCKDAVDEVIVVLHLARDFGDVCWLVRLSVILPPLSIVQRDLGGRR